MSIPLEERREGDSRKSGNKDLEDLQAQECYPYLLDLEVFPEEHSLDSFRNICLWRHERVIPNQHGMLYNLPLWTEERVYDYERYLNISPEASTLSLDRIKNLQRTLVKQFEK